MGEIKGGRRERKKKIGEKEWGRGRKREGGGKKKRGREGPKISYPKARDLVVSAVPGTA